MKTILITGANRGLGLAHTQRFAERGATVFATARAPAEALELQQLAQLHRGRVHVLCYDALDTNAPIKLKAELGGTALDLAFFNAGASAKIRAGFGATDTGAISQLIEINAFAPLKLAEAIVDNVVASERKIFAFQSSLMGSIGDNGSGGALAYRLSKCTLNMIAKDIAVELRARGVISVALHPGWVQTRMGGAHAPLTQAQSVPSQQDLLERLTLEDSGSFFNFDGTLLPW
jgi:NAD(P)-dependent dehydrogenase (short-subunit alcohol dehydrogenase family)